MNSTDYTPPKIWTWDKPNGGNFAGINRPTAGSRVQQDMPVGRHPLQLYSMGTPNGVKVTIMLEELLSLGHAGAEYNAWLIKISDGGQFGSGFVDLNPNSKIPVLMDRSVSHPIRVFESGSILMYLGGGFGHFYAYAPVKIEYAIDRFAMEVKRQLDVLDQHLAKNEYLAGNEYTIADMAVFPWYGGLVKGWLYSAAEFLSVHEYQHVNRWADTLYARPAVKRGRMVNQLRGELSEQLHERHEASDFDTQTQDKLVK